MSTIFVIREKKGSAINRIDTPARFYGVQAALARAAAAVGVPRIRLDDNWGDRQ